MSTIGEPYHMRVTTYNHVRNYVSFALKFLEDHPDQPLVMHTLPASSEPANAESSKAGSKRKADDDPAPSAKKPKSKMPQCTDAVSRLLTVVEIVQREHFASRKTGQSGLHQYNEISTLEAEGLAPATEEIDPLDAALRGKKFTKIKVTPFMRVTLCVRPVPELVERGATYQGEPAVRKKSKAAKTRERTQRRAEKSSAE
ncbi:hypothetical protein AURDEDRAFT_161151 [Auricularia subglabra TFB-10046 SS5]|nr:hypothetical protein AURDEDRAFT_161151 [Auricularia subglabra TFB-10046 SS5]